jgi:amino acid transporter
MLGYSRILYAAARDRNFFAIFAKLHATEAYPIVSVVFLGCVAAVFCWIPLKHVLQAILSIRAVIPFMAQIAGAVVLRLREPDRPRPFRMWLYPLPAIVALGLWSYVALSQKKGLKIGALYVVIAGCIFFFSREWLLKRHARAAADAQH